MVAELGGNHLHRTFFEKREATDWQEIAIFASQISQL